MFISFRIEVTFCIFEGSWRRRLTNLYDVSFESSMYLISSSLKGVLFLSMKIFCEEGQEFCIIGVVFGFVGFSEIFWFEEEELLEEVFIEESNSIGDDSNWRLEVFKSFSVRGESFV